MTGRQDPASLIAEIEDLKRRIRILESAPQQPARSQRGGTFSLIPTDGGPAAMLRFGSFSGPTGSSEGVSLYDTNGSTVVAITENVKGLLAPSFSLPCHMEQNSVVVTSGSFTNTWFTHCVYQMHKNIYMRTFIDAGANTAWEAKIVEDRSGNATDVASYNNATGGTVARVVTFCFACPGVKVGLDDPTAETLPHYRLQVRRTSGVNNVTVYEPEWAAVSDLMIAGDSDGNPFVGAP